MTASDERGCLFVVATPIGNLEDITMRAARVLREADRVLCEDTRVTRVLCAHLGVTAPLVRCDAHAEASMVASVLGWLEAGERLALVSDAGTPAVSDPGSRLVAAVAAEGYAVVPIPGPSALTAALSASGLGERGFAFHGFLDKGKKGAGQLERLPPGTHAYFVPARDVPALAASIAAMQHVSAVAIGREITKMNETFYRGAPEVVAAAVAADAYAGKGEAVLIVDVVAGEVDDDAIDRALQAQIEAGASKRDAVDGVAGALGVPRKRVYKRALTLG